MKKEEIESIVKTVRENYVNFIPTLKSESVDEDTIRNFVKNLDSRGIKVIAVSTPAGKQLVMTENPYYRDYCIKSRKIDSDFPIKIDEDVNVVFLYQWYTFEMTGKNIIEIIRLDTIKE
jgi:hypothetical protein